MKFKYILLAGAVSLMMAGCSENSFLDNPPQATLSDATMTSVDGANLLINAAYAALGGPAGQTNSVCFYPTSNWSYGEVRSDDAYKGGGGVGDVNDIHKMETFDVNASNVNLDIKWYHLFCSVQRCNSALRVLNSATDDQIEKRQIRIAEMKVLRAHFYFELSRLFNKIPYFDETVGSNDEYKTISNNQYTRDEILGKLAKEMLDAAEVLPETQTEVGRINKYIAYAYAAKIKLYQAYKQDETTHAVTSVDKGLMQEVVTLCDKLINSGKYDLLSDFQGLDLIANENGKESVFAIQYSANDGTINGGRINWSNLLNSPAGGSPYGGDGFFLPSQDLINAYQTDANGLPDFDYQSRADYSKVTDNGNNTYTLSNTTPTVDPRLDFVVGRPNISWKTYTKTACNGWVRDKGTYGYNCTKRFWVSPESSDMIQGWPWGASQMNWQIIRYADVLLWKAEALIEIGSDLNTARSLINKVRERAKNSSYVKDFTDKSKNAANYSISLYSADNWTQDYARKALRTEMRLETAMEGERFFDLVRWGIADQVMNNFLTAEKTKRIYYANSKFTKGKDEYLAIPNNQYGFSGGTYVQNPGYPSFK
jgi:hypothetical protein